MNLDYPPRRILVPHDFSDRSRKALGYAAQMAAQTGASVLVLHVGPPIPTFAYPLPEATALQTAQWTQTLHERQDAAREALQEELEPWASDIEFETRFEEGESGASILRVAEEAGCSLIVMGSHGRTGLARAIIGSVAEKVARHAEVPVLIVR